MNIALYNSTMPIRIIYMAVLYLLLLPVTQAAGELLISPTRVIFDKKTRTASISVVNAGNEANTYRIEFVQRRMKEDGGFENVKKALPGEQFSNKMIRYSPRQVSLQPGQAQAVRLMLRKPSNLAEGEYRSHLLFRAIPKASTTSVGKQRGSDNSISIQLIPVMGISIPIIVRHGDVQATLNIDKLRFYPKVSNLLFDLKRFGNMSVYGDITISFTNRSGKKWVLKKINGLAVYTPNKYRRMSMPIQAPNGVELTHGTMTVQFNETKEAGGKLLAEKSIQIP